MARVESEYSFKGVKTAYLEAGKYRAVIAYTMGSSVLRLRDEENRIDVFRYKEEITAEDIDNTAREIWGLPTLYLPNRFDRGVLKTSDAVYNLPVNEVDLQNHLHGFVQKRSHKLELCEVQGDKAVCRTSFEFDETDEMYACFPLKFKISYTFTLSDEGLKQEIELESRADKALPVSICTHTCINAPIVDGGDPAQLTFEVPIGKRCILDERCLPTEELRELDDYDKLYKSGEMKAVLHDISNDMYTAEETTLDGAPFYGVIITDNQSGRRIINEVSREFKFWNMWNDKGVNGYFCPEPMTAMINSANLSLPREVSGYAELQKGEVFKCWQRFEVI